MIIISILSGVRVAYKFVSKERRHCKKRNDIKAIQIDLQFNHCSLPNNTRPGTYMVRIAINARA